METTHTTALAALVLGRPGDPGALLAATAAAVALALAASLARRRGWPLAVRRALGFFLLLALLAVGAGLLPRESHALARPGLLVAAQILFWVGVFEAAQALIVDLAAVRWLRRPPAPRILRDFATFAFALAVFFVALRGTLGVNIASLLATSAMISVVLGLALQETLGSFFAGLALQMEAPLAVGDWVRVDSHEGRVTQVGWRTVRLVTLDGDELTLPNSLLARSTLTNFSRPTAAHRVLVPLSVHYRHPPQGVLAALTEAMRGVPGVLAEPAPQALVWEYGESGIVYQARFWVADFPLFPAARSEVESRFWYRLRRDRLEIAYPTRVLVNAPAAREPADRAQRVVEALRRVDLLAPLSEAERLLLAERIHPLLFGGGEAVIRQGEHGDSCFVVLRGRVEVRVASEAGEAVVNTLGPGSVFGEMSLLTGEPRSATVVAAEETEVLAVRSADFSRVVAADPAVLEGVTRVVADRRGRLAQAIQETREAAAARAAEHQDLLDRVRAFFGVPRTRP